MQAHRATLTNPFPRYAIITATMQPTHEGITAPPEVNIAGNVIAPKTAYGI